MLLLTVVAAVSVFTHDLDSGNLELDYLMTGIAFSLAKIMDNFVCL